MGFPSHDITSNELRQEEYNLSSSHCEQKTDGKDMTSCRYVEVLNSYLLKTTMRFRAIEVRIFILMWWGNANIFPFKVEE